MLADTWLIKYEVDIEVGCVLAHICWIYMSEEQNGCGSFAMWQPYSFSDIKYVYSGMGVDFEHMYAYSYMHAYILTGSCIMSNYIHT